MVDAPKKDTKQRVGDMMDIVDGAILLAMMTAYLSNKYPDVMDEVLTWMERMYGKEILLHSRVHGPTLRDHSH